MRRLLPALLFLLAAAAPAQSRGIEPGAVRSARAQEAGSISGTWDLYWQTRRGPRQSGHMVFRQNGSALRAELHGQGQVSARGTVNGDSFSLRGTRMLVGYRIDGRWQGDRLEGSFRVLTTNRSFTGVRRR